MITRRTKYGAKRVTQLPHAMSDSDTLGLIQNGTQAPCFVRKAEIDHARYA